MQGEGSCFPSCLQVCACKCVKENQVAEQEPGGSHGEGNCIAVSMAPSSPGSMQKNDSKPKPLFRTKTIALLYVFSMLT